MVQEVGAEVAAAASSAASAWPQLHADDTDSGQLRPLPQQPSNSIAGGPGRPRGQKARAQALEASLQVLSAALVGIWRQARIRDGMLCVRKARLQCCGICW